MSRIYIVTDNNTGKGILVRAPNQSQAIRHAATSQFSCEVASQEDLVRLIQSGVTIAESGRAPAAQVDFVDNAQPA